VSLDVENPLHLILNAGRIHEERPSSQKQKTVGTRRSVASKWLPAHQSTLPEHRQPSRCYHGTCNKLRTSHKLHDQAVYV